MSVASPATATHTADETLVDGTPAVVLHDQSIVNDETRLTGELGVASWLAVGAVLPFRVFDTHIRYVDPATGQTVQIENATLHHRNEVLAGIADPWLLARAAVVARGITWSARLGTTIPLGSTVPDPFLLGDEGLAHEHTQFGTGTFEPVFGIEAYRAFGAVTVDAYWLTLQSLYANSHGYKAGNRYAAGLGAASDLGTARWRFRATLERTSETAESWSGVVYTTEGNIGRTDVLAGAEATFRVSEDWSGALAVKVPVYTHIVGGQVDTPLYLSLSISTHEHLWTPRHAHPAVVAPGADWTGLDKLDVSTDGSAPPLAPAAGKLTVFDFWADWCKPCRELDLALAEVARRHPGELAVRKVNVVDADTPAWTTYLEPGGFDLPHVKLYGRDGKLVWERSGGAPVLAAAVEDALLGAPASPVPPAAPVPPPAAPVPPVAPVAPAPAHPGAPVHERAAPRRIDIAVTDAGYTPARITIARGQPVVLVFTRTSEKTCAVDVHFTLPDGRKIDRRLPLGQPVEVPLQLDRAGELTYACGMDMVHGTIVVAPR